MYVSVLVHNSSIRELVQARSGQVRLGGIGILVVVSKMALLLREE